MAEATYTTRRALFAGAAIFAAAPAVAVSAQPPLQVLWDQARAYEQQINGKHYGFGDEAERALLADTYRHTAMEEAILTAPIRSRQDAAVKLWCAFANIEDGGLTSRADKQALLQVAEWLRAV